MPVLNIHRPSDKPSPCQRLPGACPQEVTAKSLQREVDDLRGLLRAVLADVGHVHLAPRLVDEIEEITE
jgi:hypothetical protein